MKQYQKRVVVYSVSNLTFTKRTEPAMPSKYNGSHIHISITYIKMMHFEAHVDEQLISLQSEVVGRPMLSPANLIPVQLSRWLVGHASVRLPSPFSPPHA